MTLSGMGRWVMRQTQAFGTSVAMRLGCFSSGMRYAFCPANEMGQSIQPAGSPTLEIGDPSRTSICLRIPQLIQSLLTCWKSIENSDILNPFRRGRRKWIQFDNDIQGMQVSVIILSQYSTSVLVTGLVLLQIGQLFLENVSKCGN